MKRYIKYIISVLSLSCIVSCVQNDEIANPNDGGQMSLRLVSSTMTRSADDTAGLNEDLLVKADLYLFEADANGDAKGASLWHETFDEFNAETGTNGGATLPVFNIPANVLSKLGSSAKLYVIANYNGSDALPESATLAALQKQAVADAKWGQKTNEGAWVPQSSFVMDGIGDVSVNNNSLTGTIYLTRAAAKIELTITGFTGVPAGGVQDASGAHWLPDFITHNIDDQEVISIGAYVKLQNAVANSYVGAPMAAGSYKYDATTAVDGYYTYDTKADNGSYSQLIPFYSYSSDWTAAGGANRASLLLVVPWKKVGTTEVQNCYYEIPIGTRENNLIERNKHYKIGVNVGTLGSFAPSTNVTITPAYITVVDWSTGQTDVSISESRYLVVDENNVVMNNVNEYSIAYTSSHPVTIEIISVSKPNFSGKVATTNTYTPAANNKVTVTPTVDTNGRGNTNPFTLEDLGNAIKLSHTLVNDNNSNAFDYAAYTITAKIYHTDNTSFSETITFTQYPAMYVEAYLNSDYKNDSDDDNDNAHKGYVWVNGVQTGGSGSSLLGGVNGIGSATNANPNMYVITTTALSRESNYIIADPRAEAYDNSLGSNNTTWSVSAPALYYVDSKDRRLNYYYPAGVTSATTEKIIAPKFRVASSYGVTYTHSYDEMRRRCASYQEDGYPAGRWRMPTAAEVKYIVSMSAKEIIPLLFNNKDEYACAEGYIVANNGTVTFTNDKTISGVAVRCVYDDWYWGSERVKSSGSNTLTQFTWGDQPR